MKTLILLLLPFTMLSQPCFTNTGVITNTFGFGFGFPEECDYSVSFMDDPIDCHGAFNRRPQFLSFTTTSDTTWTISLTTSNAPLNSLVWSIWDACPFQGGDIVASIECGGWDCITWTSVGFEAIVYLPEGTYWFWPGLYSDGQTCVGGVVEGALNIGGECIEPDPPLPVVPCPTYTVQSGGDIFTYCGEETGPEVFIPGFPCGQFDMYVTVEFETDGSPYPIEVVSMANYSDFPNSPVNHQQFIIMDACDGSIVATTYQFSCAVGSGLCGGSSLGSSPEYTAWLCLPAGTYIAYIGYMNSTDLPFDTYFEQFGCITYTFGAPSLLDLPNEDSSNEDSSNVDSSNVDSSPAYPRFTKEVILGRGVFIRDRHTGRLYDIMTKRLAE